MSVPKKKRTKSSKGRRASHFGLKPLTLGTCKKCGKAVRPHYACSCETVAAAPVKKEAAPKKEAPKKEAPKKEAAKSSK